MKKRSNKSRDLFRLLLGVIVVVLLNVLSSFVFTRFDLTSEKRFTLAKSTREMLQNLDDLVYVKVYLDADFPQGAGDLKHLRDETRIMLEEFRAFAGDNVQYEFIVPGEGKTKKEREQVYQQLNEKGLKLIQPRLTADEGGGITRQVFVPGAIAVYKEREIPIQLFYTNSEQIDPQEVNRAVEKIEYELTNAIRKLQMTRKPRVAFVQGHGELDSMFTTDFANTLREYYSVSYVTIGGQLRALRDTMQKAEQIRNKYDVIVLAQPQKLISEEDKFIIDQFLMYGGKALWMMDPVEINFDSLRINGSTLVLNDSVNVDDLFFKYGLRVNNNIALDLQHLELLLNVAPPGTPTQWQCFPWPYFFFAQSKQDHPIVNGLDAVKFNYAGTIDTLETQGVKKTVLLRSSKYSRYVKSPFRLDMRAALMKPNERMFDKSNLPLAVLLEGTFESAYNNRIPPDIAGSKEIGFKARSPETKMIVIADGEIAANTYRGRDLEPMGYDRCSRYTFANKAFLLNAVNYLCEDASLLEVRSRQLTVRLLDKRRISESRLKWQLYNNLLPVGIISVFGLLAFWLRKRKYAQKDPAPKKT